MMNSPTRRRTTPLFLLGLLVSVACTADAQPQAEVEVPPRVAEILVRSEFGQRVRGGIRLSEDAQDTLLNEGNTNSGHGIGHKSPI